MNKLAILAALCVSLPAFAQFDPSALQKAAEKANTDASKAAEKVGGEDGKAALEKGKDAAKASANSFAAKQVEEKVNDKLMDDARKNQCVFKSNSDQFQEKCDKQMQNLVDSLVWAKQQLTDAGVTGFKFEVSGHTDSKGNAKKNLALSQKRAAKIVKELVAKKVPQKEIIAIGMGSKQMLENPDDTKEKQAKNRRFELRVRIEKL